MMSARDQPSDPTTTAEVSDGTDGQFEFAEDLDISRAPPLAHTVTARRAVYHDGSGRGTVSEVLVCAGL